MLRILYFFCDKVWKRVVFFYNQNVFCDQKINRFLSVQKMFTGDSEACLVYSET